MTIDLTSGEDAGWMSFTIEDEGKMDDGRRRVRINRGRSRHAIVAIETDDEGKPVLDPSEPETLAEARARERQSGGCDDRTER